MSPRLQPTLAELEPAFPHWEKTKDLIDQCIDIMLNQSQSGHPGGSRSKVHGTVVTMLSGVMRWDIRHPEKRFADRFLLACGHTNPLIYGALAVLNEALRIKYKQTGDERYAVPKADERQLTWEDLLTLRHVGGLPGHAEMKGKTLFFKFNTGPSGHGVPAAAGEALAMKLAGVGDEVRVFGFEGEGGLTPGAVHEAKNSAYGLGLDNLVFFVDWNDYGIDDRPFSTVVAGGPEDWFKPYGWHVTGTMEGEDWASFTQAYLDLFDPAVTPAPKLVWSRNKKGRGYYVYDNKSHGAPHKRNNENFWKCRQDFASKYGIQFEEQGAGPADSAEGQLKQNESYLRTVMKVLEDDQALVDYLAGTLVAMGDAVPEELEGFRLPETNALKDPAIFDFKNFPAELYHKPGSNAPNRSGLANYGAWLNSYTQQKYGYPLIIAASADLADSTNISGFAKGFGEREGTGWYDRNENTAGAVIPQTITEFGTAGILAGMTAVNFSKTPEDEFKGYLGVCSTYGSFSYLKYGAFRLLSQTAQDSELKVGQVIWVAGHSGPETAEDARTHFGIFSPAVTQLFPDGHVVNIYPWEYNEVPVTIAAALETGVPVVALHLTRPGIEIPDRKTLGMASHFDAAKGAYLIKDYDPNRPKEGVVIIRGTSTTNNLVKILPKLKESGPNVKVVAAISFELFRRQSQTYRDSILTEADMANSMIITNGGLKTMGAWTFNPIAREYGLSADWDGKWRSGGQIDEVLAEAKLDPDSIWEGIVRFAADKDKRLSRISSWSQEA